MQHGGSAAVDYGHEKGDNLWYDIQLQEIRVIRVLSLGVGDK